MSGAGENDRDVLAGEYVLGLLDPGATEAIERAASADPALAAAIAAWQARLDPLGDTAGTAAPSDALWARIESGMRLRPAPPMPNLPDPVAPAAEASGAAAPWRGVAVAGMMLAAGLAAFILWRTVTQRPAEPPFQAIALLAAPDSLQASLRAQVVGRNTLTVVSLKQVSAPPGRRMVLWAWPREAPAPVPLGPVGASGGTVALPYPVREGMPVMITSEPPADQLPKLPGPTLFAGLLTVFR